MIRFTFAFLCLAFVSCDRDVPTKPAGKATDFEDLFDLFGQQPSEDSTQADRQPIAHRPIAHRPIAHRPIAHKSMIAHRPIAHKSMIAHRPIAHRRSLKMKKPDQLRWN